MCDDTSFLPDLTSVTHPIWDGRDGVGAGAGAGDFIEPGLTDVPTALILEDPTGPLGVPIEVAEAVVSLDSRLTRRADREPMLGVPTFDLPIEGGAPNSKPGADGDR